ncbi:MipA/OmpV family protein [Roseateles sp. PN1]|uniref:MipA/OmpV family protein n=1 Tax=Roseateles sp. PN1 TaxID=3137372 RepID=UPI003139BD9E
MAHLNLPLVWLLGLAAIQPSLALGQALTPADAAASAAWPAAGGANADAAASAATTPDQTKAQAPGSAPSAASVEASADEPSWFTMPGDDFHYLIGASASYNPEYAGARHMSAGLKPMWAASWGKWRLSSSGGAGLMGFGLESIGPGSGASRDLLRSEKLRLGLSLRLDNGRDSQAAAYTEGLPDVPRTVRLRFYASYVLTPEWQLAAAWSQDALGRQGGANFDVNLARRLFRSSSSELMAGLSLSASDSRYMRSYFGVPPDSPAAKRLGQSFEPGAGLNELGLSLSYIRALTPRWMFNANAGAMSLLGPAAASPLTERRYGYSLNMGIGYRN